VLLGGPVPAPAVWAGMGLVAAGLAVGLRTSSPARTRTARVVHTPVRTDSRDDGVGATAGL
jgi:hypothetical protein